MKKIFAGKTVLVTGGSGSIGGQIVRHVLKYGPRAVRVFSNDEDGQFNLQRSLGGDRRVRFQIGDVRDRMRLRKAVEGCDVVFHAAAMKHVPFCELNPFEAVMTNVNGTQNVLEAALEAGAEKVVTISTDKATNPVNVLGATKLLAERLTTTAEYYKGARKTVFCSVRFGNVLASRGSVVPIFKGQIRDGGPLTVTDPEMTRFIMNLDQSVELVLKAASVAVGGEIFILKMPTVRIGDLAAVMIETLAPRFGLDPKKVRVKTIGVRNGEKFHEELLTETESRTCLETEDMFILLTPEIDARFVKDERLKRGYGKFWKTKATSYSSDQAAVMTRSQIRKTLTEDVLEA